MFLGSVIANYTRFFTQLFLPAICLLCGNTCQSSCNLCQACLQALPILADNCLKCALFFHGRSNSTPICGKCLNAPPPFDKLFALFPYEPPIIKMITELKFNQALSHAKALGELLADKIKNDWYASSSLPNLIIPIPLHPKRLQERGYNQAVEIARPIAKLLSIPIQLEGVIRAKHTQEQSSLRKRARQQNIQNAFQIQSRFDHLTIAVIDDVVTTGNTMNEFCQQLRKQGAEQIHVWCAARCSL